MQRQIKTTKSGTDQFGRRSLHILHIILEVVMEEQHSDLRDFINLKISGFYAMLVLLRVIGKKFGDADLNDVMVEAGEDGVQNKNIKLHCNKTNKNYTGMFINR